MQLDIYVPAFIRYVYLYEHIEGVREGVVTKVKAQQRICVMRARHLCGRHLDKKGLSWGLGVEI